jgi:hypothetical protein
MRLGSEHWNSSLADRATIYWKCGAKESWSSLDRLGIASQHELRITGGAPHCFCISLW